jgi:hypothetical protein
VKNSEGKETLKATVPMRLIFEEGFDAKWLDREIKRFEGKYLRLVDTLNGVLKSIKSKIRKDRVLLYWKFGDEVLTFMDENQNGVLFLDNATAHLIRDTSASEKLINRCKRFRVLYPDISKIDPIRSFDSYVATFEGGYISAKRKQSKEHKEVKHA